MVCSCGNPTRPGQAYCNACHAKYMKEWRKTHKMSDEQRMKNTARSHLNLYVKRGVVDKKPCAICGSRSHLEAHHLDYSKPLKVRWLCRSHHIGTTKHNARRKTSVKQQYVKLSHSLLQRFLLNLTSRSGNLFSSGMNDYGTGCSISFPRYVLKKRLRGAREPGAGHALFLHAT